MAKGDIVKISDLFLKYKKTLIAPQGSVIKEVVVVVEEVTNIKVDKKYFKYNVSSKTIFCTAPSSIKSEIKIFEEDIKNQLVKKLGVKNTPNFFI